MNVRLLFLTLAGLALIAGLSLSAFGAYNYLFYVSEPEARCERLLAEAERKLQQATAAKGMSDEEVLTKAALREAEDSKVVCTIAKAQRQSMNQTTFWLVPVSLLVTVVAVGTLIILRRSSA